MRTLSILSYHGIMPSELELENLEKSCCTWK